MNEDHDYAQDSSSNQDLIKKMMEERLKPRICLKRLHVTKPYKFKTEPAVGSLFNKPDFSDLVVLSANQSFYVHKLILAANSEVFRHLLCGQWAERSQKELRLQEHEVCQPHVGNFLEFFYTGSVWLSSKTTLALFVLSDKYDVSSLREGCVRFLLDALRVMTSDGQQLPIETLDVDTLYHLLTTWSACCPEITSAAKYNLACRLSHAHRSSNDPFISSLPMEVLIQLVHYDNLPSIDEFKLWQTIVKLIQSRQLDNDVESELLSGIRYGLLSSDQLYDVEQHPLTRTHSVIGQMVYCAVVKLAFGSKHPDDPRFTGSLFMPRSPLHM
ncbi:unnamed protein product [Dimorphilus gyrociliatus]|uniref:BTB domain-containing protein n=1 Tax=Dimorphilus gyrociliatus TaxID=2664684 RepID=A0A7I8VDD4_9ANNE|nr:unnamed protein product [Dimorphilus gyrociliatus]